ncbi:zinc-binding dehydrogenase [Streptomyces sennicomposti]
MLELTDGEGVHAVFDGAGGPTFSTSLEVPRTHGTLVFYGPLIGDVPTIAMNEIPRSIRLTYGTLPDHIRTREDFSTYAAELFAMVARGELVVRIGGRYPLAEAARAHADIESRTTTGKLLLLPRPAPGDTAERANVTARRTGVPCSSSEAPARVVVTSARPPGHGQ